MSKMIERVARALQNEFSAFYRFSPAEGEHLARAVIESMREPTETMRDAGRDACWSRDQADTSYESWAAMISEALK